jgi:hypothetical protein
VGGEKAQQAPGEMVRAFGVEPEQRGAQEAVQRQCPRPDA